MAQLLISQTEGQAQKLKQSEQKAKKNRKPPSRTKQEKKAYQKSPKSTLDLKISRPEIGTKKARTAKRLKAHFPALRETKKPQKNEDAEQQYLKSEYRKMPKD